MVGGVALRVIDAADIALLDARAVAHVAFTAGGTAVGSGGPLEREAAAATLSKDLMDGLRDRARRGLTVTAVAESEDGVIAVGSYQPVGELAEIVAVATLPARRLRGVGGAVTALLAQHARSQGVRTMLLSAQNEDVARIYRRIGFRQVGSTCAAQRPSTEASDQGQGLPGS